MSRTATKEIVQHQGWLWKRGEGYEGEDGLTGGNTNATLPSQGQASSGTLKKGIFRGDGTKGGSSVLATTASNKTGQDLASELNLNADMLLNGLERMLRGKGEKKRFFKLVTMEERLGPSADTSLSQGPNASMSMSHGRGFRPSDLYQIQVELRYYSKESADASSLKGVIVLSPDCEVVTKTDDASFKLITPGRCYYLRPDGDASSATGITAAFQWSDALRRQIRSLFALHQVMTRQASNMMMGSGSEGAGPGSPMISTNSRARLLRADSALPVEGETIPSTLAEVLANPTTRRDFRNFLDTALAIENLQFYEDLEVLAKIGSGNEFDKKARYVFENYIEPGSPNEVNLSSAQRKALLLARDKPKVSDFDDAKAEVFKLMEDNFFKRFYREAMEKTGAFAALYATLGIDGFNAVLQHFGPVKTDLERMLLTYRSRLKRADTSIDLIKKELSSSSRDISVLHQSSSRRALIAAYHITATRLDALLDYADEMRNQVVSPLDTLLKKIDVDIQTIHRSVREPVGDLEECKRLMQAAKSDLERAKLSGSAQAEQIKLQLAESEVALENAETFHSKPIEAAMAKLESLELYRIETQKQIVRYATIAESNMMSEMSKAAELFAIASKTVHIEVDIKELTLNMEKELSTGRRT